MTRTTRRETNRLHAEIMDGIAEYLEEREHATRESRCGTIAEDVPAHWLRMTVLAASPHAVYLPEFRFILDVPRALQAPLLH